jgi:Mn-dependent DtxR family transcriptional regulator
MNTGRQLVNQIRRKQLLVCAYRSDEEPGRAAVTEQELTSLMQIGSEDCSALVHRLSSRGLIANEADGGIHLTDRGQRLLERMGRPQYRDGELPGAAPA